MGTDANAEFNVPDAFAGMNGFVSIENMKNSNSFALSYDSCLSHK